MSSKRLDMLPRQSISQKLRIYDGGRLSASLIDVSASMDRQDRDLQAPSADWKLIQKNTFTRWANEHLKQVNKVAADLEVDLSDGVRLIALVEILSQKKVGKYNKRPVHKNQKLENISICLAFLQDVEKIKIVNIDSSDIVGCNMKLILGLIWTLILHYAISMPMWDGDGGSTTNNHDQTPKQKLLSWIMSRTPDKPIHNFASDWNSGIAIGALVDAIAPGLCPDWMTWDPKKNVANATEAMAAAEKWLDVPQLIKPAEMCDPAVDELSMMTYLSQFPSAKLKQDAPLRPRINPARIRAFGPGIEPSGNTVGTPAQFKVETFSAGRGDVEVRIINPRGAPEQCQVSFNNDKLLSYACVYVPTMPGQYQVGVKFAGHEIPKSPFLVRVDGSPGDPSKVTARGSGIEKSGVVVHRRTNFEVLTKNAGNGAVDVSILDPSGHKDSVHPVVHKRTDDVWTVEYAPSTEGIHKISVLFGGGPIPGSPFTVVVSSAFDGHKCYVTGRGVQPKGIRVEDVCEYRVHTENAGGDAELVTKVVGPSGNEEHVSVKKLDPKTYECTYMPKRVGQYIISAMYGGQPVARSPFRIDVAPKKDSRIRAYGPGLWHGIVGYPAYFSVETNGETGALGFSIEGPSQAKIDCKDNGDGSADIAYWPTSPGEYAVHVLCNEEDIPLSPFMADISPMKGKYDSTKVEVSGSGVQKLGVTVNKWAEFLVDTSRAGHAALSVVALEPNHHQVDVDVKDNKDGTFSCRYMPKRGVRHSIFITYGHMSVPNSPFRVMVQGASNPARVKVFGPAIEGPVKVNQPTHIIVDCSDAGPGDVAIALTNERGLDVPGVTTENRENMFRIDFVPSSVGTYTAPIFFAEHEIPNSPFKIHVIPNIETGKIIIQGLDDRVYVESVNDFTVNARPIAPHGQGKVKAMLTDPTGVRTEVPIVNNKDGTYTGIYTPLDKGLHKLDITYEGANVPRSPFAFNVVPGFDANRVKAFGPGLEGGNTNRPQKFTVQTRGAGPGRLSLTVEGPSEAKFSCTDNSNGRFAVEYLPTKAGIYAIGIKFAEKSIPGSPFPVEIIDEINPDKVRCYGPGIELKGVRKGQPGNFTINASHSGPGTPEVAAIDHRGKKKQGSVKARGDGLFDASYYLDVEGPCKVEVYYAGRPVAGSPFSSQILPPYDANKVRVTGDGVSPKGVTASLPTTFLMDTRDAGHADHDVMILDPSKDFVRPKILDKGDQTYVVTYTPCDAGRYSINIKYGGDPVPLSPFYVMSTATGDASQVKILDGIRSTVPVGETRVIHLDTSHAGFGNVTCNIHTPDGSDVDLEINENQKGKVNVSYVPRLPGVYEINLRFGGKPIPNGKFSQQAVDPKSLEKEKKKEAGKLGSSNREQLNSVDFLIPVGPVFSFVSAEVTTPSGKKHLPKLDDNHDKMVRIGYLPTEIGLHRLDVTYNKQPVYGNPFHFYVHSLLRGNVTAYGPGLSHGIVRRPCNFTIITKDANAGDLSVAVEGPCKAELKCQDNKDGTCSVSYLPTTIGEYSIIVRFGDHHIEGSPFTAKIMPPDGEEQKTAQILVGTNSEVSLKVDESDISNLTATIRSPSGEEKGCALKRLADGHLSVSFIPREVGDYWVSILRAGKHISNSPFRISVTESQIGNASQVRAYGKGLSKGSANEISEFYVDTNNAGYGNLSLSIEGPSKADLNCEDRDDNTCRVMYRPTEPGNYVINIKFADKHIPGSPYLVKVEGQPTGRITERIVRQKEAPDIHVGSDCELSLHIPGSSRYDLEATVNSPSGLAEQCSVQERRNDNYVVRFVPRELGVHLVTVRHKGIGIPGSPFPFTVGPIIDGGADKVRALGPGLQNGEVNTPSTFNIYTREAGAGGLSIAVEGPSKAEIDFQDRRDGSSEVTYVCSESGDYLVSIKFKDDHIPGSPFKVHVVPSAQEAKKMALHELQEKNHEINKPTAFAVDLNGVRGQLDARVIAPSGAEEQAVIQELDNNRCAVRFIPRENGRHAIHVRSNGNQIQGSPFHIQVGREEPHANQVKASGEGLSHGMTGQFCKFAVNTSKAGPGALAVTIDGPSKVLLICHEIPEGYEFVYTPTEPGDYHVNVRYGGNAHIPGSPFKVHVEGLGRFSGLSEHADVIVESVTKTSTTQKYAANRKLHDSDASKITATGTGLQRATANKESTFTVHTARAGYNALMVGIVGPTAPCEEVLVKHIGQRQYNVSYVVRERGDYHLMVKWGDQHIPGSPFQIHVQ